MRQSTLLILSIVFALPTGCAHRATQAPAEAPASSSRVASPSRYELPGENVPLPGAGPFRRADWFRGVWRERREAFAERAPEQRGALVFLGDSITQGWGDDLGGSFAGTPVANRGISGDTSRGVLYRLTEDVISLRPRGVVLLVGTNDIADGATPETIVGNVRLIVEQLLAAQPQLPIVLCEVMPSSATKDRPSAVIRELNERYARLAAEFPSVHVAPIHKVFANDQGDAKPEEFPDLLHPNEAGYAKWAEALRPTLRELDLLD